MLRSGGVWKKFSQESCGGLGCSSNSGSTGKVEVINWRSWQVQVKLARVGLRLCVEVFLLWLGQWSASVRAGRFPWRNSDSIQLHRGIVETSSVRQTAARRIRFPLERMSACKDRCPHYEKISTVWYFRYVSNSLQGEEGAKLYIFRLKLEMKFFIC